MLDKTAPKEGAVIWQEGDYAGYITSSSYSPLLGKSVMLGWLRFRDGYLAEEVMIEGRKARRVNPPFYDVEGRRAEPKRLFLTRVVASESAIAEALATAKATKLRAFHVAPDELFLEGDLSFNLNDPMPL
ncbi:MAG: glycine cleavage T C-terminal barrel domain-containing protein [Deinococcales bacterium]